MSVKISVERLSDLIGTIYDCALAPDRWNAAVEDIRSAFGFANAMMSVTALSAGRTDFHAAAGVGPADLARAAEYGPEIMALWGGASRIRRFPLGEPVVLSQANDHAVWTRSRYYREWAEPQGLLDAVTLPVARDGDRMGRISFARHRASGEIDRDELAGLRFLAPHISRAVSIGALLDLKTLEASQLAETIDALAAGVVLLDRHGGIVRANGAAEAMLRRRDPIVSRRGLLTVSHRDAEHRFEALLQQAASGAAGAGHRAVRFPIHQENGAPCMIHALPLQSGDIRPGLMPKAVLAVFIVPPNRSSQPPAASMASLFHLTPAETRVLERICEGQTPSEAAAALDVAPATVKTHLLRVFEKTGCRRQADLVRLAASLSAPL